MFDFLIHTAEKVIGKLVTTFVLFLPKLFISKPDYTGHWCATLSAPEYIEESIEIDLFQEQNKLKGGGATTICYRGSNNSLTKATSQIISFQAKIEKRYLRRGKLIIQLTRKAIQGNEAMTFSLLACKNELNGSYTSTKFTGEKKVIFQRK